MNDKYTILYFWTISLNHEEFISATIIMQNIEQTSPFNNYSLTHKWLGFRLINTDINETQQDHQLNGTVTAMCERFMINF